jgi:ribosomal protein L23
MPTAKSTIKTAAKPKPKAVKPKSKAKAKEVKEVVLPKVLVPRLSEKAVNLSAGAVYTFNIPLTLGKIGVRAEFQKAYKLTPRRINIVRQGRSKKAVIYLPAGQKIDFV